ncbi:MAG: (S)-ureidoglycine aminohydrolase [Chloroflexales bacterium]|nr:(S)-ureidoglycine aminohydrolase [Chloroflexales bacterium]
MTDLFGHTRSVVAPRYALITPPGLVRAPLPAWPDAACAVVISPAMGARFTQILVDLPPAAAARRAYPDDELLLFVRAGAVRVTIGDATQVGDADERLGPGGYAFIPPRRTYRIAADDTGADLLVFQRRYTPLADTPAPAPVVGHEQEVAGAPFMGDEAAMLKLLLPDAPAFDMAVNIFTFQPGATLPIVETHIMEHGLLMIQGQGIYRLADDWHPVQAGDVIWMAPYCPQWFVATGKTPARYIYYKDVNRDPLE